MSIGSVRWRRWSRASTGLAASLGSRWGPLVQKLPWWFAVGVERVAVPATPLDSTVVVRMSSANESSAQNPWNDARGGLDSPMNWGTTTGASTWIIRHL